MIFDIVRRSTVLALLYGALLGLGLHSGTAVAQSQPPHGHPETFIVYFSRDSVHLGPKATQSVARAAAAVTREKAKGLFSHVKVIAYSSVSQELADQRAEVVQKALVEAGVPATDIHTEGRAKLKPEVPAAERIDHPRNRRVRIILYRPGD